jgi:hypothetical protein
MLETQPLISSILFVSLLRGISLFDMAEHTLYSNQ